MDELFEALFSAFPVLILVFLIVAGIIGIVWLTFHYPWSILITIPVFVWIITAFTKIM